MSIRVKVYGFLVLLAALAGGGYFVKKKFFNGDVAQANGGAETKGAAKKDGEKKPFPWSWSRPRKGAISAFVSSTANLQAVRDVELAARTEGVVREVLVEEGDLVRSRSSFVPARRPRREDPAGSSPIRSLNRPVCSMTRRASAMKRPSPRSRTTQTEVKRSEKAFAEGLVSEKEVDDLRYKVAELQHDQHVAASEQKEFDHHVEELEAELAQVKYDLSQTQVMAPFAGHITERKVELGQTVRNLDPLFRLGAFSPLEAEVHLSERDARRVRPARRPDFSLGSGSEMRRGRGAAASALWSTTRRGRSKLPLTMQPPGRLFKPGAFVRVDIETDAREKATLIPKRALVQQDGQTYVFVADGAAGQAARSEARIRVRRGGGDPRRSRPRGERRRRRPRQSQRRLEDQGSAGWRRSAELLENEFHRGRT